ncbi:hypothetical protein OS175_09040 [Marinicella sp. S1101]|nr:hypothetical protein [Marinicella marina]MCX7554021.1 hypothetical protein [Marinicella marina]
MNDKFDFIKRPVSFFLLLTGILVNVCLASVNDEQTKVDPMSSLDDFENPNRPLNENDIWNLDFYRYLLEQNDINLAIKGLAHLNSAYATLVEMKSGKKILSD